MSAELLDLLQLGNKGELVGNCLLYISTYRRKRGKTKECIDLRWKCSGEDEQTRRLYEGSPPLVSLPRKQKKIRGTIRRERFTILFHFQSPLSQKKYSEYLPSTNGNNWGGTVWERWYFRWNQGESKVGGDKKCGNYAGKNTGETGNYEELWGHF